MSTSLFSIAGLIVLAYALGSVSGSLLLGKFRGVDIRHAGSGNAGGTNALRTVGWQFALAVVSVDIAKGALATWLPQVLLSHPPHWLPIVCAGAAIVGHMFPVFYGFRGGKGAATWMGGLMILSPVALLAMLLTAMLILMLTGFVGLCTVIAAFASAITLTLTTSPAVGLWAFAIAFLIAMAHHENLRRMLAGNENRFAKATVWYWLGRR